MKASSLKSLALFLWGAVILIFFLVGISLLPTAGLLSRFIPGFNATNISPRPSKLAPTITLTPTQLIIYLPSATARVVTDIPITETPTLGQLVPLLPYSLNLSPDTDPLTGLKPIHPEILNRRPLAVKISTFPRGIVRPYQSGLTRADLVYEYYIEDGLTRFIAVFYSQDAPRAGPVRSGRYFDEYIMRMYRSSLVFANADERVEKRLLESELKPLLFLPRNDNCPPLCRDTRIQGYNNVFVDTAGVGPKLTDNSRQDLRASLFGALMYPMILPVINRIYTHYSMYSYNYWEYDPVRRIYKRYSDSADAVRFTQGEMFSPHIDNLTGEQLSANNVIVLVVPHIFHNEFDRADQVFDITLDGSGDAYLFRDGRMLKTRWVRDKVDQPIRLEDENGQPITMQPGVTYFQVINPESSMAQSVDVMEFFFFIPSRKVTSTPTPFGFVPSPTPRKSHN